MRRVLNVAVGLALLATTAACGRGGFNRERPDEFAVGRQAPLVIPPDYALRPPQPGAARPQDVSPSAQALDALFGGTAPRSPSETSALQAAGRESAEAGIRSAAGDPGTAVVDKGSVTRDIVAAPEGDGQAARVTAGGQ
ncbi:Beta-barrel assembly machine subunit BamF [Sphingomonas guangdongensis]|uniref:Beta-barrel assembly machine subunit BamF n=1 Tax=Sphingomonas guangdongensis TaxID=1141890 RepID=A0A285QIG4_9SPHN|nr:DUF3035 domain-containing protein [Sphingomonas guangdongensis]SOB79862.1 Beta-barrel assembly machine subunit BamF [Sphingomonas guangdongensis]